MKSHSPPLTVAVDFVPFVDCPYCDSTQQCQIDAGAGGWAELMDCEECGQTMRVRYDD